MSFDPHSPRVGPFVLGDAIGQGAMGTVHHAFHEETGARVAVKVVRAEVAADPGALRNLTSEIRAVAALDHPHIVRIYDVGLLTPAEAAADERLVAGTPWLAMEYADQGSLKRRLRTLERGELFDILRSLLEALAHAHARGILHLDLKPANVLFGARTDGPILSDFGMGVVGDPDPSGNFVRGTPHFMAPELVRGRWEELGPWTDLYALGNLAWLAATGELPVGGDDVDAIFNAQMTREPGAFEPICDLPSGYEAWCRRLLQKDPDRRFRFASDALGEMLTLAERPLPERLPADWRVAEDDAAAEVNEVTGLGLAAVREPPVVGRTRERTRLWEALRSADAGQPRVVVLRGPAGTGKSRLARWLGVRAHEIGAAAFLWTDHAPDRGLLTALRRAFPVDLRDYDAESGLATRIIDRGVAPDDAQDVAAWIARERLPSNGSGRHAPPELAWHALRAVADDRPVVVVCDDVHEPCAATSPDTVPFLAWLLQRGLPLRAVFVLTAHDEVLSDRPSVSAALAALEARPGVDTIELGPLSEQARRALARRMLPLDPSLAAEVAARSDGNPGYAVELLQDLAQRRVLRPSRHGLTLPPGVPLTAPPQLDGAYQAHLDHVLADHPEWKVPLGLAAALGPAVETVRWRAVCETLGVAWPTGLAERLVEERLWRVEREGHHRFLFPAMAEALIPEDPLVHRVVARLLQDPILVGVAWARGGDAHRALRVWLRAAEDATGAQLASLVGRMRPLAAVLRPDNPHAVDPYSVDVLAAEVRAALDLGDLDDARRAATLLRKLSTDPEDRDRANELLASVAAAAGDGELLRSLVPLLPPSWRRSALKRALGDIDSGPFGDSPADALERARIAFARGTSPETVLAMLVADGEPSDHLTQARRHHFEGRVRHALGDVDGALVSHRAARRRFRALGHVEEYLARLDLLVSLAAISEDEALRQLESDPLRDVAPLYAASQTVAEVLIRIARPRDVRWTECFGALTTLVAGEGLLDVEDARRLAHGAGRAARPDRKVALEALIDRHLASD